MPFEHSVLIVSFNQEKALPSRDLLRDYKPSCGPLFEALVSIQHIRTHCAEWCVRATSRQLITCFVCLPFRILLTQPTFILYPSFVPTEPFSTKNSLTVIGGKWNQVDNRRTHWHSTLCWITSLKLKHTSSVLIKPTDTLTPHPQVMGGCSSSSVHPPSFCLLITLYC